MKYFQPFDFAFFLIGIIVCKRLLSIALAARPLASKDERNESECINNDSVG